MTEKQSKPESDQSSTSNYISEEINLNLNLIISQLDDLMMSAKKLTDTSKKIERTERLNDFKDKFISLTNQFQETELKVLKINLMNLLKLSSRNDLKNEELINEIIENVQNLMSADNGDNERLSLIEKLNDLSNTSEILSDQTDNDKNRTIADYFAEWSEIPSGSSTSLANWIDNYKMTQGWQRDSSLDKALRNYLLSKLTAHAENVVKEAGYSENAVIKTLIREVKEVKNYNEYKETIEKIIAQIKDPEKEQVKKKLQDDVEEWLLFDKENINEQELLPKVLLENYLPGWNERAKEIAYIKLNEMLVQDLTNARETLKNSFGYRLRKRFGFARQYVDLVNRLNTEIDNISKSSTAKLATTEVFLAELKSLGEAYNSFFNTRGLGDLPAVKVLRKVRNKIYNNLYNNPYFSLTTDQCRQATLSENSGFFNETSMFLDNLNQELKGNFFKRIYNEFFSRQSDIIRNNLIVGVQKKLTLLIDLDKANPKDFQNFRGNFGLYLESLRAAISKIDELLKTKKEGWHEPLKKELQDLLEDAVKRIVLKENAHKQVNYQAEFGIELATCVYPICKLALDKNNKVTEELEKYLWMKYNHTDQGIFLGFVEVYSTEVSNEKVEDFVERFCSEIVVHNEQDPSVIPQTNNKESEEQIAKEINEFGRIDNNDNLQKFKNSICRSFTSTGFGSLMRKNVVMNPNSTKERNANTLESLAGLVKYIPTIGDLFSTVLQKIAGIVAIKGKTERSNMQQATAEKLDHIDDIQQTAEYVARKLTQMLEFQIVQLEKEKVEELAELLVDRMLMALTDPKWSDQFKDLSLQQLGRALCEAVFLVDLKHGPLNLFEFPLLRKSDETKFSLSNGWVLEDMLQSGIEIVDEKGVTHYYTGESSLPAKYGFIRGTKQLVEKLAYTEKNPAVKIAMQKLAKQDQYIPRLSFNNLPDMGDKSMLVTQEKLNKAEKETAEELKKVKQEAAEELKKAKQETTLLIEELATKVGSLEAQLKEQAVQNAELKTTVMQVVAQNAELTSKVDRLLVLFEKQFEKPDAHSDESVFKAPAAFFPNNGSPAVEKSLTQNNSVVAEETHRPTSNLP
ncbi:MAG: hypothetical protein WBE18_02690 [Gammaproteobacteria bacterium]